MSGKSCGTRFPTFPATRPPFKPQPQQPPQQPTGGSSTPPIPIPMRSDPMQVAAFVAGANAQAAAMEQSADDHACSCQRQPEWPEGMPTNTSDLPRPTGTMLCTAESVASQVTSNCLLGPTNETECTRQRRMIKNKSKVYQAISTGADLGTGALGFSPYTAAEAGENLVFMFNVPTADLSACIEISELKVTVTSGAVGDFTLSESPVAMANGRSTWYAAEDNVVEPVTQEGEQKTGRKIVTTDSNCNCEVIYLFAVFDKNGQVEFTIPGLKATNYTATITISISYEVKRHYATLDCPFPARCGEPDWAAPATAAL